MCIYLLYKALLNMKCQLRTKLNDAYMGISFLFFSKSHGSSKSATFDEWLVEKKSKKHQKQQKEKEEKLRKQIEQENKRLARIEGQKSFEDWKNSKSKQKLDLSALEKKRDDIIREEPGRHYSLSFERWLSRNHGTLDLYY